MYFRKMSGNKCYLSPLNAHDAEQFAVWLNDLELTVNLDLYNSVINTENEKALLENLSKEHNYSIIDQETDALLGSAGFAAIDHLNQTAEAGIFIGNKQYWNRGYGTEALTLLLDYGFRALNLHNVLLKVYAFNERALACYEKTGFKRIGQRREAVLRGNKKSDVAYLDILYDEFYEKNTILKKIAETRGA